VIDQNTVCERLHALERYSQELRALRERLSKELLEADIGNQWTVEHGLQVAIECVFDVASHWVAAERLGTPANYREAIELLGKHGVLSPDFVEHNLGMAGFRNVMVHEYLDVDLDVVWRMLDEAPDQFDEFIRQIALQLKRQKHEERPKDKGSG
jgi:uncharacterized protein YutE (UPF0331/DUF86 family)